MVRTVSRQAAALAKARERRRSLDAARDEHDRRVEEATAAALVALEARSEAEQALTAATAALGETLCNLLAEDVPAERVAALLELDSAEVRRLTKAAARPAVTASKPSGDGSTGSRSREVGEADASRDESTCRH